MSGKTNVDPVEKTCREGVDVALMAKWRWSEKGNFNFAPSQARGWHFTHNVSWMMFTHPFGALVPTEAQTGPER